MKKILLSLALLSLAGLAFAQEKGIQFESHLSWAQIKAKAKSENKYIFMDVFATWCGPCKQMDQNVYPSEKLGAYFNDKFISVKVQMDQTKADGDAVKAWYADAKQIVDAYQIDVLPTLLIFSPDGKLVTKSAGYLKEEQLMTMASKSLEKKPAYYERLKEFKKGRLTPKEMEDLARSATSYEEPETAQKIAEQCINDYLLKLPDHELFTKENLQFMIDYLGSPQSKAFKLFQQQPEKINVVLGDYTAQNAIMLYIEKNYLPNDKTWKTEKPDWNALEKTVVAKFGALGKERVYEQRMWYYQDIEDWANYETWYQKYFKDYLKTARLDPNNLSWMLFEHTDSPEVLKFACDIVMPYTIEKWYANDFQVYDTYANLLYKTGRRDDAIKWEQRADRMANHNNKDIADALEKMKKGVPTWNPVSN